MDRTFPLIGRALRAIPRWLFLAALIYAPWAYGCTTTRTLVGLNWILGVVLALWLIDLAWTRRVPIVPRTLMIISGALLVLGWWMALNARWIYDSEYYLFIPIKRMLAQAPGSVDQAVSAAWMTRATALLLVSCFVADLSRRPAWLMRLWWTIGIAGGSIALFGLLEKATGAPMIFWQPTPRPITTFFATYYYHANAGAFLNLALPPAWGLALRTFTKPTTPWARALWLSVLVILLVGMFSDTSRMAQLIAVFLLIALAVNSNKLVLRRVVHAEPKYVFIRVMVVAATLFAIAQASHLDLAWKRWQSFGGPVAENGRLLASQAALRAAPDAGLVGFGPGTFRIIFPYYTGDLGQRIANVWQYLHEDYLQTLLEWGWIGAALWAAFFFGGMGAALRNWRAAAAANWSPRYRVILPLVLLALAGVMLHALVDFPLQIASLQLYVATYLGLCWGSGGWGKKKVESRK